MRFSATTAFLLIVLGRMPPSQCSGEDETAVKIHAAAHVGASNNDEPPKKNLRGLSATDYDCDKGCALTVEPVCGTNDITYSNECLAVCQGAVVAKQGACDGDQDGAVAIVDRSSYIAEGSVSLDVMNQFKSEGFNYVARRSMISNGTLEEPEYDEGDDEDSFWESWPQNLRAVRITEDGDEYVSNSDVDTMDVSGLPDTTDEYIPMMSGNGDAGGNDFNGGDRALKVLGQDTRVQQSSTKYPYSTIVQLELRGGIKWCTGTVVSPTSVLTNAHCVYKKSESTWYRLGGASPGRTRGSENPYGFWNYATATIYTSYTQGRGGYDIAVVRLHPKNGRFIGDNAGYLALAQMNNANRGTALQTATITGYPGDKPSGTRWHSACPNTYRMVSTYDVRHECDTFGGNSGSGLIDSNNYVRGVHWGGNSNFNVGNILRGQRFYTIAGWAGHGNTGILRTYEDRSMCLDASMRTGNVYMHKCHHGDNQVWYYDKDTKQIKSKHDDKCLDVNRDNRNILVWSCHGGTNQKWLYDSDSKLLKSQWNRNLCADYSLRTDNVYLHSCHGNENQQWRFPVFFFR